MTAQPPEAIMGQEPRPDSPWPEDYESPSMPPMNAENEDPQLGEIVRRLIIVERKLNLVYERQLSHPLCPKPGLCLGLSENLLRMEGRLEKMDADHKKEIETIWLDLDGQKMWSSKVAGGLAVLVVLIGLFGPIIRRAIGLE